jgi:DHA3 family macrolide efflux protein-like MFS transporter
MNSCYRHLVSFPKTAYRESEKLAFSMQMFHALRNRAILSLWFGQLTSHIGDEIYKVAFIWLAIDVAGKNTGYFAAMQFMSVLAFGIIGGKWCDRWNPFRTMVITDLLRALLALTPVVFHYLQWPAFGALVVTSILISGLGAFFDPSLQSALPVICQNPKILKGANGLLSTTFRLARVMGPAIIGILANLILTIHYFTLNALSFAVSAICIYSVQKKFQTHVIPVTAVSNETILGNFFQTFHLLQQRVILYRVIILKTIVSGAWGLAYGVGLAMMMREFSGNNVQAFGSVMGAYGVGNVLAALVMGNVERKNPEWWLYLGLIWLGVGFVGIGFSNTMPLILFFSAFSAVGGPMNDLSCIEMIQEVIQLRDLPRIFRLKMTLDNLAFLIFLLISPALFHFLSVRSVIVFCGIITIGAGMVGYRWMYLRRLP